MLPVVWCDGWRLPMVVPVCAGSSMRGGGGEGNELSSVVAHDSSTKNNLPLIVPPEITCLP